MTKRRERRKGTHTFTLTINFDRNIYMYKYNQLDTMALCKALQ
jgi:hypothetical protein